MDIKPTILLAMALFLVSAPEPDSRAIAEMTANFIVPSDQHALQAAEIADRRDIARQVKPAQTGQESSAEKVEPGQTRPDVS